MTVFSFEENTNCTKNTSPTNSSDYGVILSRYSPYELHISRYAIPTFVCLIEGKCRNGTLTDWITGDCKWTNETIKYFENNVCNMTCLNPTKTCQEAKYDSSCSDINAGEASKINNIEIHNKNATCFKCGSPFQVVKEVSLPKGMSDQFNANKTETDAGAAAEAMKNLSSILSLMENLTIASISMGNVKGVLKKISEIKTSYFIYSSETDIRVLDDVGALKNYPSAFSIPEDAAKKALKQNTKNAFLGVFRFPNMTKDAENSTVLNDEVYAIEMGAEISNLSNAISLTFKTDHHSLHQTGTPVCKSWDGNGHQPNWTTEGCSTLIKGENITCKCEHLTFFAVLMIPPNKTHSISQNDLTALTYITYIGCGISLFFLSIGLFMHFLMRCWILDSDVHYYVNIGYYCFIFIFTFSTFIVVLRWLSMLKLSRLNKVEKVQRSRTATSDITTILGLCCMLGLSWSFAFFSYGALRLPSYYIFTILNSFQGFFLFIYYLKSSSLLGDSAASEESDMTEDTNTENPYEDLPTEDTKKAI
ncbi:adhesion G-protein coupled receptor G2 isoform X3 [Sinocyclocheilus grahami]|uniref:adhesion G-protein coupled receptor G2 isoform X3 n=1 Tax=Sinocyclocheilus grahami TaxID=75366 RepID=UPI0007AD0DDD|nr:PREDICTED: adhesion G-protein coupled receptor G2-like isoform X3 [Sinocyclocheilus grahami]